MSPLLTCQILRLLVNTLAADEKYPVLTRETLTIPILNQLSQKQKLFLSFLLHLWNLRYNLNILMKKMTLIDLVFPKLRTPKTWSHKCLKSHISENPSTTNMVKFLKHCWNLHHSTFTLFIDNFQANWIGKSLCYWHGKSCDCFLTHWLPMKRILILLETI